MSRAQYASATNLPNFWISPTGSNTSGDGSAFSPWRDTQKAIDTLHESWDCCSITPIITLLPGNTHTPFNSRQQLHGAEVIKICGSTGNAADVTLQGVPTVDCIFAKDNAVFDLADFSFQGGANGVHVGQSGIVDFKRLRTGTVDEVQLFANEGGKLNATGDWSCVGDALSHIGAQRQGKFILVKSQTVTIPGKQTFVQGFAGLFYGAFAQTTKMLFAGAGVPLVEGPKYRFEVGSSWQHNGYDPNLTFPGNSPGVAKTGSYGDWM